MKKYLITRLSVFLGLLLVLSACIPAIRQGGGSASQPDPGEGASSAEGAYHKITAEEAKELIDAGGVTVVDVRTAEEFAAAHLPGAINVPNEGIGDELPQALPDQEGALVVYCRTGVRSKQASDKLVELGYENVNDMGGIVDWPYETQSGA